MSETDGVEWPQLMCVLCGLIVIFNQRGSKEPYPGRCPANAGGDHIDPRSPAAAQAVLLRQTWLRGQDAET